MAGKRKNNQNNDLSNFVNSKESKNSMVQMVLVLVLSSVVLVVKNSIIGSIGFYWVDCLNSSVTLFSILFMTAFKNEKYFDKWKAIFLDFKKAIFFILFGTALISMTLAFDWFVKWLKTDCFKPIIFDLGFIEISSNHLLMPFVLIDDFMSYFIFTVALIHIYTPIVLFVFDYCQKKVN